MSDEKDFGMAELIRRLSAIEDKLDRLVRLEERQNNHEDGLRRAFGRLDSLDERVRVLEVTGGKVEVKTGNASAFHSYVIGFAMSVATGVLVFFLRT